MPPSIQQNSHKDVSIDCAPVSDVVVMLTVRLMRCNNNIAVTSHLAHLCPGMF